MNITLSWDESLPQILDGHTLSAAALHAVREQLLKDEGFRAQVIESLKASTPKVSDEAIAEALKHELIAFLKAKVQPLKEELNAVVRDFDHMERVHASDYAARRKKELIAKLSELNSL